MPAPKGKASPSNRRPVRGLTSKQEDRLRDIAGEFENVASDNLEMSPREVHRRLMWIEDNLMWLLLDDVQQRAARIEAKAKEA